MYKTSLIVICIQCIQAVLVLSDMGGRPTRGLSMLRMGKRNLGFLRMGRSYLPPLVPPSYDLPGDDINERQLIGAPRMGKDLEDYDLPRYQSARAPPVPRLGIYDEYINEIRRELASNPEELYNNAHTGSYLGRQKRSTDTQLTDETADTPTSSESETVNKEKRALPRFGMREVETNNNNPFPRLGLYERENPFPRLGLYERASFPRLGVREEDENERSVPMMPRLGLRESDLLNEVEAEERALPRYGLRSAEEEKRAMSMLRMGKREEETPNEEKRKMSMLRMGKRKMSMLRMGKRGGMSMLRMGRSQPAEAPEEKRKMSMLRMGRSSTDTSDDSYSNEQKRKMSMLRMGKRKMSMLRMGRSYSDSDKRAMSMLRMGRGMSMLRMGRSSPDMNDQNQLTPDEEQKRAMSMLRMGRGMSMLRMGRSANKEEMKVTDDKRAMSMLRMGKKDEDKSES